MPKLHYYRIPTHTEEWYAFRTVGTKDYPGGIGGSEVATVLGLNPYDTGAKLYHLKLGTIEPWKEDKEVMFHGRHQENYIAKMWQYWDGSKEGMMENYENDSIIRRCEKVNAYVVNDKYPWLFASLDRRMIQKGGFKMTGGNEPLKMSCPLELKTLSHFASDKWESGIPAYYLLQVHLYMIVMDSDYAEIAIFKDGNKFNVEPVIRNEELCDKIIRGTKEWWFGRVIPAKKALKDQQKAEVEGDVDLSERSQAVIDSYEPEPDYTEAYTDLMNERFVAEFPSMQGGMEDFRLCQKDEILRKVNKVVKEERTFIKNKLLKKMVDNKVEVISFDNEGKITNLKRKNAVNPTFKINLKDKPDEDLVKNHFKSFGLDTY